MKNRKQTQTRPQAGKNSINLLDNTKMKISKNDRVISKHYPTFYHLW